MTTTREQVLTLHDAGDRTASQIAAALDVTPGYVFSILRDERPDREHGNLGRRTSELRVSILFHAKVERMKPAQIAKKLGVSRAYVYRILSEI